jgi:hypothetical protein
MIDLSDGARTSLEKYLDQVRLSLWGCKAVDRDEVERSVLEHVEGEFEGATDTVTSQELDAVLRRLGSPRQWIPEEELPLWRKTLLRLRTGPEDWRLAYLSFGLLVVGFLILPSAVVLVPASFVLARAALAVADDSENFKAQRWLLYPSLILVYSLTVCALLLWPLGLLFPLAGEYEHTVRDSYVRFHDDLHYWIMASSFAIAGVGLWWTVLGAVLLKWWRPPQWLFRPFGDWFRQKWALVLLLIGLAFFAPTLGLGIWYWL